ncbi:MAG: cyclic nucleotide-binding domain-containing protein, partial [Deltaproteobacteria bacterium]|nr:cyclic nucleotide-binding domain-containing protein [Deltaproteobacteria bacterium]
LKEGMHTLRQDGLLKCQQGMTTLEQVLEKTVIQKESLPHYLLNPDEMVFENGDTIIKEGNTDTSFYKLIQGCLEVFKGQNLIAEISQTNTYFGEMSALVGSRRSATIKSKGRSIVKVFPGDKLSEVLENYPDISKQIIDTLVLRLNESSNRLSEIMQNRIELERTYVNQLTANAASAGMMPTSNRPITGAPKPGAGQGVAMPTKQSALAKLAAKAGAAGAAKTGVAGGNGSAGTPMIRPVTSRPDSQPYAQTALVGGPQRGAPPANTQIPGNRTSDQVAGVSGNMRPIVQPQKSATALPRPVPAVEVQPDYQEAPVSVVPAPPARPKPVLTAKPPQKMAAAGTPNDPSLTRSSFIRNLLPADQTQLVVARDTAPAAKILRDVR